MTVITIKSKKFNVEEIAEQALNLANSGSIQITGSRDIETIQNSNNPAETERKMVLAQAIYRSLKYTWSPLWNRVDENDLVGSILAANTNRVNNIRQGFSK